MLTFSTVHVGYTTPSFNPHPTLESSSPRARPSPASSYALPQASTLIPVPALPPLLSPTANPNPPSLSDTQASFAELRNRYHTTVMVERDRARSVSLFEQMRALDMDQANDVRNQFLQDIHGSMSALLGCPAGSRTSDVTSTVAAASLRRLLRDLSGPCATLR